MNHILCDRFSYDGILYVVIVLRMNHILCHRFSYDSILYVVIVLLLQTQKVEF